MPPVTEEELRDALASHDLEIARLQRITTGKFNESWYVTLADGRDIVLRVAPPDDAGFLFYERGMMKQEPGLHRLVREKTRVPVAEILVFDESRRYLDRDLIVMERLPGRAMSEAPIPAAAAERAFEEVGRHLRELHDACRAERYGYLGEHRPMEPEDTWAGAFRVMWEKLVEDIRACGAYDRDEAALVKGALAKHLSRFDRGVPSSLLHMDVWAQNILVETEGAAAGRVTGIVDWDRALWGDVEIEFAVLDYCGVTTPSFWRGYGRERDTSEPARVRGLFYLLYELQKYIVIRTLRGKDPARAATYKVQAARLVREVTRGPRSATHGF